MTDQSASKADRDPWDAFDVDQDIMETAIWETGVAVVERHDDPGPAQFRVGNAAEFGLEAAIKR